jgi:hypothetical protein
VAAEPPYQVGQLSPDGMWLWDGQRWVASAAQPRPISRGSRRWIWWLAGGCALLLVIAIAGGTYGIVSLVHSFQSGSLSCLPSDFPHYPGATVTRDYTTVGTNVAPGDSRECQETLDSNDDVSTVTDFYASRLNSGDWKISADDRANGELKFRRVSRPQTVGVVDLLGRGQRTVIQIKLDS